MLAAQRGKGPECNSTPASERLSGLPDMRQVIALMDVRIDEYK